MAELPVAAQARNGVRTQQAGVDLPCERFAAPLELRGVDAPQRPAGEGLETVVVTPRERCSDGERVPGERQRQPDPSEPPEEGRHAVACRERPVDVEGGDDRAGGVWDAGTSRTRLYSSL